MFFPFRALSYTKTGPTLTILFISISCLFASPLFGQMSDAEIEALQKRAIDEGWTFSVGRNPATERPLEELCGLVMPEDWHKMAPFDACKADRELPAAFDWREVTGLPPVRNQGGCGSCWAFASAGALECNIMVRDGESVDLSEQWLVSCNSDGWGCDGGWWTHDYFQWKDDPCGDSGAVLETYFPYTATDEPCGCPYPHSYFIQSWSYIGDPYGIPNADAIKQAIMTYGPVTVGIHVGSAFRAYNGGILNVSESGSINHGVVLVGWDDTQGMTGVWFLRNSWGPGWGEDGYMRIPYYYSQVGYAGCYVDYRPAERLAILDDDMYDDASGDGDGIPEAGETVQVILSFESRFLSTLSGVDATLFFDDARIAVTQGTAFIGDIYPGDTVQNSASPFEIVIPADYDARLDSMYVAYSWDGGAGADTQAVERAIGGTPILLVDDDDGSIEGFYRNYLDARRIPYNIRVDTGYQGPGFPYIENVDLAIWFTGDYRTSPLNLTDIAIMQDWLDKGGGLFLSGQGIAAQLSTYNPTFLESYLKAEYLSSGLVPILGDVPGCSVFDEGDTVIIIGYTGADNQTLPDKIGSVAGSIGELNYVDNSGYGAVSYSGDYRSLFLSFGFEAITNGDSRRLHRDTVMAKILEFFSIGSSGSAPTASNLSVLTADPTHVTDHTPTFAWAYDDADGGAQQAYHIQTTDDNFWLAPPVWDYQESASADTQVVYAGIDLVDGVEYYMRVRTFNGLFWSDWTYCDMRMNSVPVPDALSPDNGQEILNETVVLSHANIADDEGDSLTYSYELYSDSLLSDKIASATGILPDEGALSSWTVPTTLTADMDYFWRVRASDPFEDGRWSATAVFHTISYMYGDANGDRVVNVGDGVYVVAYVFKGGPAPEPMQAGDATCDEACNVADAVYIINFVFKGGPEPDCSQP